MLNVSVAHLSEDLKLLSLEHYYDNTKFLEKLTFGKVAPLQQNRFLGFINFWRRSKKVNSKTTNCPFAT